MLGIDMGMSNAIPDPYLCDPKTGFPNVNGANKGVILEIRRERTVELVQEGFRWSDLMRWKAGYAINDSDDKSFSPFMGMYIAGAGEYDLSGDGKVDVIFIIRVLLNPMPELEFRYMLSERIYCCQIMIMATYITTGVFQELTSMNKEIIFTQFLSMNAR